MDYELISLFMYCIVITSYIGLLVFANKVGLVELIMKLLSVVIKLIRIFCLILSRIIRFAFPNSNLKHQGYKYKPI